MTELVYINGSMVPRDEAKISVFDHGFLYGYGLFETMRAYNGVIFRLDRHMERLRQGAEHIGLDIAGIDPSAACVEILQANKLIHARIRLTLTGGDAPGFPWEKSGGRPTIVVSARQYHQFPAEVYERGYAVDISRFRRYAGSGIASIKSVDYLVTVMARRESAARGLDESLLLNDSGFIVEGGNSNVFFIRKGVLITPKLDSGILPGITRQLVLELAAEKRIEVSEEDIMPGSLHDFNEAFMTSSVIEIMPMTSVKDKDGKMVAIGNGKPGAITRVLMAAYAGRVKQETGG